MERFQLHPILKQWFTEHFGDPTLVQQEAWPVLLDGRHTLIAAPTGSGKTLAALLPSLHKLLMQRDERKAKRTSRLKVIYITPLKALNNDIGLHISNFIAQIEETAAQMSEGSTSYKGIRCAVRTGDTSSYDRTKMLRNPPDVLITTPESLFIMLTSAGSRAMLSTAETVIVDEIHDLAADKRGAHLSLSLERLDRLCAAPLQRIGVSATQNPIADIARFLGGWEPAAPATQVPLGAVQLAPAPAVPRAVSIVESQMDKQLQVRVVLPRIEHVLPAGEAAWLALVQQVAQAMEQSRTLLVFVNSRRLCERLVLRLNDHLGYEAASAHHGSVARERRLEVEQHLKAGDLRCIVATSSLELGIDVGHVDAVIQIDVPPSAAAGIQRIGRAGHSVGSASQGLLIARYKGVLPDLAVLSQRITNRDIEPIKLPKHPIDVLSQHILSIVAMEDITLDDLQRLCSQSDSFHNYPMERLHALLKVQSGYYPFCPPMLDWDKNRDLLSKRPGTAMAAMKGAGTIPQSSAFPVHHADSRIHLGELDEEFVHESRVGDVFLLGSNAWMIRQIDKDRVYVGEATNRFSEIPFWKSEGPARSYELGAEIGDLLEIITSRLGFEESNATSGWQPQPEAIKAAIDWLQAYCHFDEYAAEELVHYVQSQLAVSLVPSARRVVIEYYKDVQQQTHVILLNPFGRRVNRTWLLAIQRHYEQTLPYRLYGNAKDNGIELVIPEWDSSWLSLMQQITAENVESLVREAIGGSPLLAIAFRRIAETSQLLSRSYKRVPLWLMRLRSEELLRSAMPFAADFPHLQEAVHDCLHQYLDLSRLQQLLREMADGHIQMVVRETAYPSPWATQFIFDYVNMKVYEGDGLDESIQLQLASMSRQLAGEVLGEGAVTLTIDPVILEGEQARLVGQQRTSLSSSSDLAGWLKEHGEQTLEQLYEALSDEQGSLLEGWLADASSRGEIAQWKGSGDSPFHWWICADELSLYEHFEDQPSIDFIIGRFIAQRLYFTEEILCKQYANLSMEAAQQFADRWLEQRRIVQAPFAAHANERIWCTVQTAERVQRQSIKAAREKVKPVSPLRWYRYLANRQYLAPDSPVSGSEGLRHVLERLQGIFLPLSHWETYILPMRVHGYKKEQLDLLCASGEVFWLCHKPADSKEGKEAKVAFFLREQTELYEPYLTTALNEASDQLAARLSDEQNALIGLLKERQSAFLTELSRESGLGPKETLQHMLTLAWEGLVSNDQFAPLRLLSGNRQDWAKTGSGFGRWYWCGTLLSRKQLAASSFVNPKVSSKENPKDASAKPALQWIHHMLGTYGLITKELVRFHSPFSWDELLPVLRRLEEWGTIVRGLFLADQVNVQFTTPEIAQEIRSYPSSGAALGQATIVAAADPANPYGLLAEWPQLSKASLGRKQGCYLLLRQEEWQLWVENNGKRIVHLPTLALADESAYKDTAKLQHDLRALFSHLFAYTGKTKLVVDLWNGQPVEASLAGKLLKELGGERDRDSIVLWLSSFQK